VRVGWREERNIKNPVFSDSMWGGGGRTEGEFQYFHLLSREKEWVEIYQGGGKKKMSEHTLYASTLPKGKKKESEGKS